MTREQAKPKPPAANLVAEATAAAAAAATWADLVNVLFDPVEGLVANAYPTRSAREEFVKSEEYRSIQRLIESAVIRTGLIKGYRAAAATAVRAYLNDFN